MTAYVLDSDKNVFTLTGIVNPVLVFAPDAEGRNRPNGEQETDDHGVPLWDLEVLETVETFGRRSTETSMVRVPSRTEPTVNALTRATFKGLTVEHFVRVPKSGGRATLGKNLRADALVGGGEQK